MSVGCRLTVRPDRRPTSRSSRYYLADPYLRFYFRFIAPNLGLIEQELTGLLWERIRAQFRAFVGVTAFEELCREWTLVADPDQGGNPAHRPRHCWEPLGVGCTGGCGGSQLARSHDPFGRMQMGGKRRWPRHGA